MGLASSSGMPIRKGAVEGEDDGEVEGNGLLRIHPELTERHNRQMSAVTTGCLMIVFMNKFLMT